MPELPDVELYLWALRPRVVGLTIDRVRVPSPFFVRTFDPPVTSLPGHAVLGLSRIGKRLIWSLDEDLFVVVHLMIAGRLRWREPGAAIPAKLGLAAFDFAHGTLLFTEAGWRKRASLHVVRGESALAALDPGGADVFTLSVATFAGRLRAANHTLKRSLTDPRLFSGIGNAYSDEILHTAQLSPARLTQAMSDGEIARLFDATRTVLRDWIERLQREAGADVPEKVNGVPPRHGGARPLRSTLSPMRRAGAAHRVREQRSELLRKLPDRRTAARRPGAVATAAGRLAEEHGRTGAAPPAGPGPWR